MQQFYRFMLAIACIWPLLPARVSAGEEFIKGVDLSVLKAAQDGGVQYKMDGKTADPLVIFKVNGCNCVRLRLFLNPTGKEAQVNTLAYTLAMAKQVKAAGLEFYLDFHYSDGWADPGHQIVPAAWKDLPQMELVQKVHDYTLETLNEFKTAGCEPDMVSVGNEITNGMIWPAGGPLNTETKWPAFIQLLKAGIRGVRDYAPANKVKIILHIDKGASTDVSEWFLGHCKKNSVDFDIIGLSYYPYWHGSLENLAKNLAALAGKYHKPILIAETDYDFSGEQGKLAFPCTPAGQRQFLDKLLTVVAATPDGLGAGVCYWEPAWIQGWKWNQMQSSNVWENRALFDQHGNALPGLAAFKWSPEGR